MGERTITQQREIRVRVICNNFKREISSTSRADSGARYSPVMDELYARYEILIRASLAAGNATISNDKNFISDVCGTQMTLRLSYIFDKRIYPSCKIRNASKNDHRYVTLHQPNLSAEYVNVCVRYFTSRINCLRLCSLRLDATSARSHPRDA